jgi:hypothetical protein
VMVSLCMNVGLACVLAVWLGLGGASVCSVWISVLLVLVNVWTVFVGISSAAVLAGRGVTCAIAYLVSAIIIVCMILLTWWILFGRRGRGSKGVAVESRQGSDANGKTPLVTQVLPAKDIRLPKSEPQTQAGPLVPATTDRPLIVTLDSDLEVAEAACAAAEVKANAVLSGVYAWQDGSAIAAAPKDDGNDTRPPIHTGGHDEVEMLSHGELQRQHPARRVSPTAIKNSHSRAGNAWKRDAAASPLDSPTLYSPAIVVDRNHHLGTAGIPDVGTRSHPLAHAGRSVGADGRFAHGMDTHISVMHRAHSNFASSGSSHADSRRRDLTAGAEGWGEGSEAGDRAYSNPSQGSFGASNSSYSEGTIPMLMDLENELREAELVSAQAEMRVTGAVSHMHSTQHGQLHQNRVSFAPSPRHYRDERLQSTAAVKDAFGARLGPEAADKPEAPEVAEDYVVELYHTTATAMSTTAGSPKA